MFLFPREIAKYHCTCMLSHLFRYLTNFRVLRSATFFKTPSREISGMEKLSGKFTSMHDFITSEKERQERQQRQTSLVDIKSESIRRLTHLCSRFFVSFRNAFKRFHFFPWIFFNLRSSFSVTICRSLSAAERFFLDKAFGFEQWGFSHTHHYAV